MSCVWHRRRLLCWSPSSHSTPCPSTLPCSPSHGCPCAQLHFAPLDYWALHITTCASTSRWPSRSSFVLLLSFLSGQLNFCLMHLLLWLHLSLLPLELSCAGMMSSVVSRDSVNGDSAAVLTAFYKLYNQLWFNSAPGFLAFPDDISTWFLLTAVIWKLHQQSSDVFVMSHTMSTPR